MSRVKQGLGNKNGLKIHSFQMGSAINTYCLLAYVLFLILNDFQADITEYDKCCFCSRDVRRGSFCLPSAVPYIP